jgi:SAM-dependent methyltransferase
MIGDYYKTKESVEEYISLAKDVSGKQLIDRLEKVLDADSVLLEIGSGPGTDWKILNKSYHVTGSDNSGEFLNHLRVENREGEFIELDAITLNTDRKFDGIYSNMVMHHLTDHELKNSIKRQAEILKPSGIVCHSFWKGEGSENHKGLSELFTKYFEIMSIEDYKEFENNDSLLFIGKKKL